MARASRTPRLSACRSHAAHEQHAGSDEHDAERLERAELRPGDPGADEHEHRCDAAGDRIHEADVRVAIGGRQQHEVHELERCRQHDPRHGGRVDVPRGDGDRREEHDGEAERDRRRGPHVLRARDEDVPAGVKRRRAEREQERRAAAARGRLAELLGNAGRKRVGRSVYHCGCDSAAQASKIVTREPASS